MPAVPDPLVPAAVLTGAVLLGLALGWLSGRVTVAVGRRRGSRLACDLHEACHRAWVATLAVLLPLLALPLSGVGEPVLPPLEHGLIVALILAGAWLLIGILFVIEDTVFQRLRVDTVDNRRARKMRTQIALLRRLTAVAVGILAVGAVLMSFSGLRAFGASLLASAGLVGIVAGLAAQSTLSNVVAGLQLAFTDALRLDDVVVVEDEWGRVEDLTLTYVVVHIWDERRLVLPTSYFTSTPFQNWTRTESRVLGAVVLHLDFTAPVAELRRRTREVVEASPLWDGRDWVLQVVDSTETTMVVRVLASAHDAPSAWDLRCDVREALLTWLQQEHPGALPRTRATLTGGLPADV